MPDWSSPSAIATPTHISWLNAIYGPATGAINAVNAYAASTTTAWVANLAQYIPLQVPFPYPVERVWWINGATITSTNVDMGIYDAGGVQLFHTGSTAMSTINVCQYATVSPGLILTPNVPYYLAWTCDNTTNRARTITASGTAYVGRTIGVLQQASALPLPVTATFAAYTATVDFQVCGITRTTTGF